ncbi:3-deoxy-D-manno-octulosonic acid transferase [Alsobacter soli]|uniref:3-deoxy-D-manno-octulosonic acid transferase n=1 Tax=Alsobacter soli TaxID=2109933 RepID=A0A2T1HSJ7_9HYPH|nr:3-deoxy-D-manno-octulosonic acid transferase [Alsobacter soli]PSC04633.1 3-deoxy-D-manno-octulosonic acid transferase [Alsobacter soli]
MSARPLSLRAYALGTRLFGPFARVLLQQRARRGKEERTRIGERRGEPSLGRPPGRLAWLHGASVGETLSMLPLVERLAQRGLNVLVTSGTVTSARLLDRRLPPGAFHQFVPLDVPAYVRRFLDHWAPDLVLVAESELWPNMLVEVDERGIPLVLVNARMSERSFRRWQRFGGMIEAVLSRIDLCLAQTPADADRLARLGAPRVGVAGNLKFDTPPPPADPLRVSALSGLVAGRPLWVAASTHPGEEEIAAAVHRAIAPHFPGLLTIVAPRHIVRGDEIAEIAGDFELRAAQRSKGLEPDSGVEFYVADTMGELGLFYRVAPVVFVGKSLVGDGGQNPIEPAKLGAAILHGPHVQNFADVYAALDRDGGSLAIPDAQQLANTLMRLLGDGQRLRRMARAAAATVDSFGGAVERTMAAVEPYLMQMHLEAR